MQHTIKKDEFYLVHGPATVKVNSGTIEVIAAKISAGEQFAVPTGKKVPLRGIKDALLDVSSAEAFMKLEEPSVPHEWDNLACKIADEREEGTLYKVMVIGEVDTGKTFFSTYLANRLLEMVGKAAILGCDTGQADIGCPGAFGMLVLEKPVIFLSELEPTHMYLLGAHSPGLHLVTALTGIMHLLRKVEKVADVLIIDTTGWVHGDGGRVIKKAKFDMVQPDMVVLMQRSNELEHLVKHLPDEMIVRLPVSRKASTPSQLERKEHRELVSRRYFVDAKIFEIPFKQVFTDRGYFLTGTKIDLDGTLYAERLSAWEGTLVVTSGPLIPEMMKNWPKDLGAIRNYIVGQEKGMMIALLDQQQNMLAIARLEEINFLNSTFRIRCNYHGDLDMIKGIQFGSLKLTEVGNEAGFVEPGSF